MTTQPAAVRARTNALKSLRKLSKTEIRGLGIGLEAIEELERALCKDLPSLRRAAYSEHRARALQGLPGIGPFEAAYLASKRTIARLGLAREDTGATMKDGRVGRG